MCLIAQQVESFTDLPHSNNGISDKDKKNDEGLNEGGDSLLTFLKPGQNLRSERNKNQTLIRNTKNK